MANERTLNDSRAPSEQPIDATLSESSQHRNRSWLRDSLSSLGRFLLFFYFVAFCILVTSVMILYLTLLQGYGSNGISRYDLFIWVVYFALVLPIFIVTVIAPIARRYTSRAEARVECELRSASLSSEANRAIIRALRRRARDLRLASWFALFLTFIAIAVGLYLFTVAGSIATRDYSARSSYARELQQEFQYEVTRGLARIKEDARLSTITSAPAVEKSIQDLARTITEKGNDINASVRELQPMEQKGNVPLYLLVSTISTRIGSVLLLIFLVQILISVYRYSVRLQTYYDARADALLLAHESEGAELEKIVALLSPERIDFGKTPSTPSDHVLNVIKDALSAAKAAKS